MADDDLERLLRGDSAEIIAALKGRLDADPDDVRAALQLGIAYATIEHWGLALTALERAVALDADDVDVRLWLARILTRLRRPDRAAFQLIQAKRLAPGDARVAHQLGITFYDKGLLDKALVELERARALDPTDARSVYAAGLVHEAKRSMAEAIGCYRAAVALAPALLDARRTLADALAQMGELDGAIVELRELLRRDRHDPQSAMNLEVLERRRSELGAGRLLGGGEAELAQSALVRHGALARDPSGAYANARCVLEIGLTDGAITELTLCLTDPAGAAQSAGDVFGVTIVSTAGLRVAADYATAASLTLLREALGCSLTQASELYARLLQERAPVTWNDATIAFVAPPEHPDGRRRGGLRIALAG